MPKNTGLIQARQRAKLSQAAAAELLGVTRVTYCRLENGHSNLSEERWRDFLAATGQEYYPLEQHIQLTEVDFAAIEARVAAWLVSPAAEDVRKAMGAARGGNRPAGKVKAITTIGDVDYAERVAEVVAQLKRKIPDQERMFDYGNVHTAIAYVLANTDLEASSDKYRKGVHRLSDALRAMGYSEDELSNIVNGR